jgi:membrane protein implicated in regulation of membrane protease activity
VIFLEVVGQLLLALLYVALGFIALGILIAPFYYLGMRLVSYKVRPTDFDSNGQYIGTNDIYHQAEVIFLRNMGRVKLHGNFEFYRVTVEAGTDVTVEGKVNFARGVCIEGKGTFSATKGITEDW